MQKFPDCGGSFLSICAHNSKLVTRKVLWLLLISQDLLSVLSYLSETQKKMEFARPKIAATPGTQQSTLTG